MRRTLISIFAVCICFESTFNLFAYNHEHLRLALAGEKNLQGFDLSGAVIYNKSFKKAILNNANLSGAKLTTCSFKDAKLQHANLNRTILNNVNFRRADLRDASLVSTISNKKTSFIRADLRRTAFTDAVLPGNWRNFNNAKMRGCILDGVIYTSDEENFGEEENSQREIFAEEEIQPEDEIQLNNFHNQSIQQEEFLEEFLNQQCSICLEDYVINDELIVLSCGHVFHSSCIDRWLRLRHTCPQCRTQIIWEDQCQRRLFTVDDQFDHDQEVPDTDSVLEEQE